MMAQLIGKNVIGFILITFAVTQPVFQLLLFYLSQDGDNEWGNGDLTAFAVLSADEMVFSFSSNYLLQLLIDQDRAFGQVDIAPLQAQDLTLAHASEEIYREQILIRMSFDGPQEGADLIFVQRLDLSFFDSWKFTGFGGVKGNISVLQSLLQRLVEDAMDILDKF